jgi:hypothetical protein
MSVDYFGTYFTADGFDFGGLINADFFDPIRLLFQNGHYVSASKLLVIAIDSISFVEFGDVNRSFIKWLDTYADLSKVGITSEELWEHRNSLLHMSNLDSRRVVAGEVRRLVSYVGALPSGVNLDTQSTGHFNLQHLILQFAEACGKWCATYGTDRSKIDDFVSRYDLITSDARMLRIPLTDGPGNMNQ